jgi:NADH dehydrogenase/NADH:ubiquinone oxidoreductase subunit G
MNVYRHCLPGEPALDPPDDGGAEEAFWDWHSQLDPEVLRRLDVSVLRRIFAKLRAAEQEYALEGPYR